MLTSTLAFCADAISLEGKPAPDIELTAVSAGGKHETVKLSSFKGKKNVVLAFYPKAMTKGCTIECKTFSQLANKLGDLDTVVFGISTDNAADQGKFIEKESLKISLFADPDKKVTESLGALSKSGMASRYSYVIDKEGTIRKVYTKVSPAAHPEEVAAYIKANLKK